MIPFPTWPNPAHSVWFAGTVMFAPVSGIPEDAVPDREPAHEDSLADPGERERERHRHVGVDDRPALHDPRVRLGVELVELHVRHLSLIHI